MAGLLSFGTRASDKTMHCLVLCARAYTQQRSSETWKQQTYNPILRYKQHKPAFAHRSTLLAARSTSTSASSATTTLLSLTAATLAH